MGQVRYLTLYHFASFLAADSDYVSFVFKWISCQSALVFFPFPVHHGEQPREKQGPGKEDGQARWVSLRRCVQCVPRMPKAKLHLQSTGRGSLINITPISKVGTVCTAFWRILRDPAFHVLKTGIDCISRLRGSFRQNRA